MNFWLVLTVNSVTFGGLLFLLSAGFSLIFGLMRIPNLTHGSLFMLGAYAGATFIIGFVKVQMNFWLAAILATLAVAMLGALIERLLLRRLPGDALAQVLVTLGLSFMAADFCLMVWGGDPINVETPAGLGGFMRIGAAVFPAYRLAIIVIAAIVAAALWLLLDRTRLGAMIRAGVDDPDMARVVGIRGLAAFHHRVRPRRRACRLRRDHRRADPVGLSRARPGHAAAGARRRHPRRHRQPARLICRQHHRRLHLQFRPGAAAGTRLFRAVSSMLLVLIFRPQGLFGRHVP